MSQVCQINNRRLLLECMATLMLLKAEYDEGSQEGAAIQAALLALKPIAPKSCRPGDMKDWSPN